MGYRMKHPSFSVQTARCLLALYVSTAVLEVYRKGPRTSDDFQLMVTDTNTAIVDCWGTIHGKKLSPAGELGISRVIQKLTPYCRLSRISDPEKRKARWAALVWVSLTFVENVRYTCTEYRELECWKRLFLSFDRMAEDLRRQFPTMDTEGTGIYMKVA